MEFSILALQQGLEFDLGPPKGVPYLDGREEAVASNIADLIRERKAPSLLVVYGADHVSKTPRRAFARRDLGVQRAYPAAGGPDLLARPGE